jgi:hypothetical protein
MVGWAGATAALVTEGIGGQPEIRGERRIRAVLFPKATAHNRSRCRSLDRVAFPSEGGEAWSGFRNPAHTEGVTTQLKRGREFAKRRPEWSWSDSRPRVRRSRAAGFRRERSRIASAAYTMRSTSNRGRHTRFRTQQRWRNPSEDRLER